MVESEPDNAHCKNDYGLCPVKLAVPRFPDKGGSFALSSSVLLVAWLMYSRCAARTFRAGRS